jgi:putative flippase GtrA
MFQQDSIRQITRYFLVGTITFIFDYALFLLLYGLFANIVLAENAKIPFTVTLNYSLHRNFTFKSNEHFKEEIPRFIGGLVVSIIAGNIYLLTLDQLVNDAITAKTLQSVTFPLFTYTLQKKFVFHS